MRTVRLKQEQGVQFRHVVSNLRAEVEGERAHARCYLLDFLTRDGATELLSPGEYDCELKRTNGAWRFVYRKVAMDRLRKKRVSTYRAGVCSNWKRTAAIWPTRTIPRC